MAASMPFLLLLALALSSASANFVSIDCGASESYTDENSIEWVGDEGYVQNGESHVVQTTNGSVSTHVMSTLRVFSTRKKNCYFIKATKGGQFLVRASFLYGNYDKKSSPPSFDLHLDGNLWGTIQTSADQLLYVEVVYVTKFDSINLCLAQTQPNQLPFISAIEVRSMDLTMYDSFDPNFALVQIKRVAYGATESIRSPSDAYDRIWEPEEIGNGLVKLTSDAETIDTSSVVDDPPITVLQNAVTTTSVKSEMLLNAGLSSDEVPIYITMFFSEVTQLDPTTDIRSFEIYIDGKSESDTIVPLYGGVNELVFTNITVSSKTQFSLLATSDSTLPPIINAMEVYVVAGPLTDGTNTKDVEGLAALQVKFGRLQEWTGDPCLPSPFTWDWVNCSTGDIPRVTALYLGGFGLSGQLPDFSSMDALMTIDLHNNSLSGSIPNFLGTLTNLKELNLADNKLSGAIPTSISKNKKLKLEVSGNPNVCPSCKTTDNTRDPSVVVTKKKINKVALIIVIAVPTFVLFWVIVGVCICIISCNKRRAMAISAMNAGQNGTGNMPNGAPQMGGKYGEAVTNQLEINMQEQRTPHHQRDQQEDERPLHY